MKKIFLLIPLFLILVGCNQEITEQDLIGGSWIRTAGYGDDNAEGGPNCYPFQDGIEFNDEDTAYNETYERNFEYLLSEKDSEITFFDNSRSYSYKIKMISEDELILEGLGLQEDRACVLEQE